MLALSVIVTAPERVPPDVGGKVTAMVQFAEAATCSPTEQVVPVASIAKSPLDFRPEIVSSLVPLLVSVTDCTDELFAHRRAARRQAGRTQRHAGRRATGVRGDCEIRGVGSRKRGRFIAEIAAADIGDGYVLHRAGCVRSHAAKVQAGGGKCHGRNPEHGPVAIRGRGWRECRATDRRVALEVARRIHDQTRIRVKPVAAREAVQYRFNLRLGALRRARA